MAAAIPSQVKNGLRARMKSQIHFANDPSLRSRLTAILKQLSDAERGIICENAGEFIEAVVDTRNYLTHLDEKSGDCILRGVQLFQATSRLEILLFLLFFKYIGFGQIEVLESLKKSGRFDLTPFKATAKNNTLPQ